MHFSLLNLARVFWSVRISYLGLTYHHVIDPGPLVLFAIRPCHCSMTWFHVVLEFSFKFTSIIPKILSITMLKPFIFADITFSTFYVFNLTLLNPLWSEIVGFIFLKKVIKYDNYTYCSCSICSKKIFCTFPKLIELLFH